MDFFRGEKGSIACPDLFDDGDLNGQPVKKLKAFLDVGEVEAMTRERWGAAKFVKSQLRIAVDNSFDDGAEPDGENTTISHENLFKMILPAVMPGQSMAHYMAILKRANIILNTKNCLYYRPAIETEIEVVRVKVNNLDFLKPESKDKYSTYLRGCKGKPAAFDEEAKWEMQWVQHTMAVAAGTAAPPPRPWTIIGM